MGPFISKKTVTKATFVGGTTQMMPQNLTESSEAANKKSLASHLYPPQYNEKLKFIEGSILYVHLCDTKCENTTLALLDVNHAYLIFVFTTGEAIRCEISGHKNGTAILIYIVETYKADNDHKFQCLHKNLKMNDLIEKCTNYYQKGDFHIQCRNCYDFAAFMTENWFQDANQVALKLKEQQIAKVPFANQKK